MYEIGYKWHGIYEEGNADYCIAKDLCILDKVMHNGIEYYVVGVKSDYSDEYIIHDNFQCDDWYDTVPYDTGHHGVWDTAAVPINQFDNYLEREIELLGYLACNDTAWKMISYDRYLAEKAAKAAEKARIKAEKKVIAAIHKKEKQKEERERRKVMICYTDDTFKEIVKGKSGDERRALESAFNTILQYGVKITLRKS